MKTEQTYLFVKPWGHLDFASCKRNLIQAKTEMLLNVKCASFHMSKQPAGKKCLPWTEKIMVALTSSLCRIFGTKFVDQKFTEYQNKSYYNMWWAQMWHLTIGCLFLAHIFFFKLRNATISSHSCCYVGLFMFLKMWEKVCVGGQENNDITLPKECFWPDILQDLPLPLWALLAWTEHF